MAKFHLRAQYGDPYTPERITRIEVREEGTDVTRVTTDPDEIREVLEITGHYSVAGWNGGQANATN